VIRALGRTAQHEARHEAVERGIHDADQRLEEMEVRLRRLEAKKRLRQRGNGHPPPTQTP